MLMIESKRLRLAHRHSCYENVFLLNIRFHSLVAICDNTRDFIAKIRTMLPEGLEGVYLCTRFWTYPRSIWKLNYVFQGNLLGRIGFRCRLNGDKPNSVDPCRCDWCYPNYSCMSILIYKTEEIYELIKFDSASMTSGFEFFLSLRVVESLYFVKIGVRSLHYIFYTNS